MKKLAITLFAVTAFTGSAIAADLPARTYTKAPPAPVMAAANWTGCYLGGGGGYGMWNQENTTFVGPGPGGPVLLADTATTGGRGYFGTVQAGCDYQFAGNWLVGAFGDYDFASMKGKLADSGLGLLGDEKLSSSWSVGGRIGYVLFPSLLTYFSGGYTQATFDRVDFNVGSIFSAIVTGTPIGTPTGAFLDKRTFKGYFLGAGDEYALSFMPGLFWKTEYRVSQFDVQNRPLLGTGFGAANYDSKKWEQSVRSELVYRFNWGGPVVARY
jgi:outer membrane immunogenic protein